MIFEQSKRSINEIVPTHGRWRTTDRVGADVRDDENGISLGVDCNRTD
ncbi:hypothetical protein BN903_26 [Halorubrum sp. AJ67]|nr:hypothetical protein BN903_26 [Halorubrum sp. AJ67]